VGTHSLQSGAAMEMYLREIPVYTIMLIGRWSSDAFLRYIRKQVEQFSRNVSKKMLTFRSFRHIPDITPRRIYGIYAKMHDLLAFCFSFYHFTNNPLHGFYSLPPRMSV
jgi:hypothetical protein